MKTCIIHHKGVYNTLIAYKTAYRTTNKDVTQVEMVDKRFRMGPFAITAGDTPRISIIH